MPDKKLTDNDIKKALEEVLKLMLCDGDLQRSSTISKTLAYINRLEAEKKELQELVDDMGDYFPACIDCEGKTPLGERTDKCVYKLNNTNYCTKRGIATIFSIRNENRELKAENKRLKGISDNKTKELLRYNASIEELHKKLETAKAENEELKEQNENLKSYVSIEFIGEATGQNLKKKIKAEAYKEFAERLKEETEVYTDSAEDDFILAVGISKIDSTLKELVGEDK